MELVALYQCFSDQTRLRILHLLAHGPLCVCHVQEILGEPQVKVSKHLAYLRARGAVETRRDGNFIIYQLPTRKDSNFERNVECLKACAQREPVFASDLRKLIKLQQSCCKPAADLPRDRRALAVAR